MIAIERLGFAGDPRAKPVLRKFLNDQSYLRVIEQRIDPASGTPIGEGADVAPKRIMTVAREAIDRIDRISQEQ